MTLFPPGMIGLACGEPPRYSDYIDMIVGLIKPPGTKFKKQTGLGPAQPFNQLAHMFLADKSLQWLFLTNDDNLPPRDAIPRLLARNVDVCTGLYFGRQMPFEPILFDSVEEHLTELTPGGPVVKRKWYKRHHMVKGESGLHPIAACGDGCLLIRRHVLEKLQYPWWEYGETLSDACDHDVVFSRKVVDAGFKLCVDYDVMVDHMTTFAIRPARDAEGNWYVDATQGTEDKTIRMYAPVPPEKVIA